MQMTSEQLYELLLPTLSMEELVPFRGRIKNTITFTLFQLMLFIHYPICRIYKLFLLNSKAILTI